MDYRDKVFLKVAENLSFTKAAKELFISQPAVTKHIKELESRLKTSLFERKGNQIFLTRSGKLTYDYLVNIARLYDDLYFEIGRLNKHFKGHLKIGASSTIAQYVLPKVLAGFHKPYPNIELFMYNGNSFQMEQKLLEGKIDLALVENNTSHPDLKYIDFLDDELLIVTGKNSVFAKQKNISLKALYKIPIILREKGSGTLEVIKNAFQQKNIDFQQLNILIHLGSTEAIKNFLVNFNGIAILSEKSIEKELQLKELHIIRIKQLHITRRFRIAHKYGHLPAIPQLFLNYLERYNF